jgi:hypothetical protein
MMGRLKSDQGQLFYEFHLGETVPEDHLVRKIDAALDLSWLRSELVALHSDFDGLGLTIRLTRAGVSDQRGPRCCEACLAAF